MPPRRNFRRRGDARPARNAVLIACEGTKTEYLYFRAMKEDFALQAVEVLPVGRDQLSIVREAAREAREREFAPVWCVFDHEFSPHNAQFAPAVAEARRAGFELAVSNPSFEFWLLLHYTPTTRQFDSNAQLIQALRDRCPRYEKSWEGCYDELRDRQDDALRNADSVLAQHRRTDPDAEFPYPSTQVHFLVRRLKAQRDEQGD